MYSKKTRKNIVVVLGIFSFIVVWSSLLYIISPREIVDAIGAHNVYWVAFLIATFAGVSSITSTSSLASIVTFSVGGADPLLLGIVTGLGLSIGDSLFYLLGARGKRVLPEKITKYTTRLELWIATKSKPTLPFIVYVYTAFTPFPGDILSIFLGISRWRYKAIIVPMVLGNMTLMTLVGLLAQNGIGVQ